MSQDIKIIKIGDAYVIEPNGGFEHIRHQMISKQIKENEKNGGMMFDLNAIDRIHGNALYSMCDDLFEVTT